MRAYSCAQIGMVIAVFVAVCAMGALLQPDDALAAQRPIKMVSSSDGGGTSGGGEWKTEPEGSYELPLGEKDSGGGGTRYHTPSATEEAMWAEKVQGIVIRTVRFVGATFSQLF